MCGDLVAENICLRIKENIILDNINLQLESGKVYAFVGKNGSGKTMLFRALSGLIDIDSGKIIYKGKTLTKKNRVLPSLGIVIENAGLYPELTGFRNLQLLAKLQNKISNEQIADAITKVGLDPNDKRPFRKYSLGMKQRIVLAQAFMENPEVLMLDEPTNALDELGVEIIREMIIDAKGNGSIVLLASHNREDIDIMADEIFFIKEGRLIKMEE